MTGNIGSPLPFSSKMMKVKVEEKKKPEEAEEVVEEGVKESEEVNPALQDSRPRSPTIVSQAPWKDPPLSLPPAPGIIDRRGTGSP